jgi:very-short-patch-repair endonuclease
MGVARVLERQQQARAMGETILSVVATDTPNTWGAWAASRRYLALLVDKTAPDAALEHLLATMPWARTITSARARFAAIAGLDPDAIDAVLDARGELERATFINDVASHDEHAHVAGWILASLRATRPSLPPVRGKRLLRVACDLAAPIAIGFQTDESSTAWVAQAFTTAGALAIELPQHPIAVIAPRAHVASAITGTSAIHSMARQGLIDFDDPAPEPRPRSKAERLLHESLSRDRRTKGKFELNHRLMLDVEREIDLLAKRARVAVEIDGWFHFREPDAYRRDRAKDLVLQQSGYVVMRYLADDITAERVALVVDEIARVLAIREGTTI